MVSLWPFGGQDNSPESFEKKLSSLATQIIDHEKRLSLLRTRGRRLKALWTLYTIIAWVIYASILALVVGIDHANMYQFAGLGLSPFLVYLVRQIIKRYYEWRVLNVETSLESLREQQKETIEKLKAVTKYDSTQALLDKYTKTAATTGAQPQGPQGPHGNNGPNQPGMGSQPTTPQGTVRKRHPPAHKASRGNSVEPQNIHESSPGPPTPQLPPDAFLQGLPPQAYVGMPPGMGLPPMSPMGQFAPPPPEEPRQPQWYDRFLDVLLGEDEMSAKNRFALICSNCRQVNGLAPPGTTNVEDIRYICGRCGAENGKPEVRDLIGKVAEEQGEKPGAQASKSKKPKAKPKASGEDRVVYEDDDGFEGVAEGVTDGEFRGTEDSGSSIEETVVVKKKKGRPSKRKG
ncbi:hypothetical protein AA313_de0202358 [Arthrobotrys entomopaga]|nr:hypothetical protein AA313_de0202358 [Arthrobotrys entomopaga]